MLMLIYFAITANAKLVN